MNLNLNKKIFFSVISFFILIYTYFSYFKYNDKITYFTTDISYNSSQLIELLNNKGLVKDPNKNFNNSSCKLFNFYDISNNCNIFIQKYYNDDFLNYIKSLVNEKNLYFIDPIIEPLSFTMQLYTYNDFMSYHFDTNFSTGSRYTVLIPLYINQYNESYLTIKNNKKEEQIIDISLGNAIVYNGDKVYHKVSKQSKNGQRITLIINLTTNKNYTIFGKILQKIRNYMLEYYTW
tara:strand:+ start:2772 stop:3470 length:699 start_codon:yes stop_codon:yes gene_type:complete